MIIKMKTFVFLWSVVCLASPVLGQQGVVSTGGDIQSPSGSVAFSIGQTAYHIIDGETGSVHQGLQQPYSFTIVGIEDLREDIAIRLYPNPAVGFVNVQLTLPAVGLKQDQFTARLYDFNGKLILDQALTNDVNTIPIDQLSSALYLLQVWKGGTFIKSFSLTKTN